LVGPQRDDFTTQIFGKNIRDFGSRGQQRLAVLQLKMHQINFVKEKLKIMPLFILDDIFSELDEGHIKLVLEKVKGMQTIFTTTHKEFMPKEIISSAAVVELERMQ